MQFKIDENLPDALVALLEEHGHDACTARQQRLNGHPDMDLAIACRTERRAIVTLDLDFSDITAFPPEEYAGIIVLRVRVNRSRTFCRYSVTFYRFWKRNR